MSFDASASGPASRLEPPSDFANRFATGKYSLGRSLHNHTADSCPQHWRKGTGYWRPAVRISWNTRTAQSIAAGYHPLHRLNYA